MEKNKIFGTILIIFLFLGMVFGVGCGTTGRSMKGESQTDDIADIDALLGLTGEETDKKDKQEGESIAEDEVLKLLGVVEEDETAVTEPGKVNEKTDLRNEVQQLEERQAALDTKEKTVREQLAQQNEKISSIQRGQAESTYQPPETTIPDWKASSFEERYQEAHQDYLAKRYRESMQKFEALLVMNTNHSLSDNCQYWIGEAYYGLGNYRQAIVAFEKVFSFQKSNKDPDAQLKLGLCYLLLGDRERAGRAFQRLIDNYPTSTFVSIAKRKIEEME